MPSILGPYEPPFNPRDRPPTWLVPLAALNHRPTTMLVICKACQHKRRWPVGELVECLLCSDEVAASELHFDEQAEQERAIRIGRRGALEAQADELLRQSELAARQCDSRE